LLLTLLHSLNKIEFYAQEPKSQNFLKPLSNKYLQITCKLAFKPSTVHIFTYKVKKTILFYKKPTL
jgi:hypothetical protein